MDVISIVACCQKNPPCLHQIISIYKINQRPFTWKVDEKPCFARSNIISKTQRMHFVDKRRNVGGTICSRYAIDAMP